MYNFTQEQVFMFFFIIGIIIGIFFDMFKVLRKAFKTSDLFTFIEDFIFLLGSSILIILGILKLNSGEIRFFLFLGIFFGILSYSLTISNLCVIILYTFVEVCKKIFEFPLHCLKKLFLSIKSANKKDI